MAAALHRIDASRALSVLAWAGALAGAVISVLALTGREPAASPRPVVVKAPVVTSFGSMSLDYAVRMTGARDPMGLQTRAGETPIQVGVTLTNVSRKAVRPTAASFALPGALRGSYEPGRLPGGVLKPFTSHRFVLRFAVPASGALGALRFRDPGRRAAVVMPLGGREALGTLDVTTHHFTAKPKTP